VRRIHTRQYLATTASDPPVASHAVARADAVLNGTTIIGSIVGTRDNKGAKCPQWTIRGRTNVVRTRALDRVDGCLRRSKRLGSR
jgi:hypothetical protein